MENDPPWTHLIHIFLDSRFTQPANLRTHVKKRHNYNVEGNKQNKCEYCGEPHPSIVQLHQHLLEDHPQQVQEERELLAREKAEKQAEKIKALQEKEARKMARMNEKAKQNDKKGKKSKIKVINSILNWNSKMQCNFLSGMGDGL